MSPQYTSHDDNPPSIYMHAELLPNIRQLTLLVSLPNITDRLHEHTTATISLSESRRAITVYWTDSRDEKVEATETLKLPVRVSETSRRSLTFAGHRVGSKDDSYITGGERKEFSFRLQVDKDEDVNMATNNGLQEDDFVPWSARDMSTCTALHCRFCSHVVMDGTIPRTNGPTNGTASQKGWVWKDLPSGNWAEMMEFWHCHKPDPQEHSHDHERSENQTREEQNASLRGYGAASQLVAAPGTIFVDVASFLVAEADFQAFKKSNPPSTLPEPSPSGVTIECERCDGILGKEDAVADGWRLYKANLSARRPERIYQEQPYHEKESFLLESFAPDIIVSAQLLELIQREGVRRFIIHAGGKDGMLLWVFNPDLRYSSSSADHSIISRRAIKVFYQYVSDVESLLEPEKGTPVSISLEELFLPTNVCDTVVNSLQQSNELLPISARIFRDWSVGFLERFERVKAR